MPHMDGPGLVREVREINPEMKVIFISGYTEDAFRQRLDSDVGIEFPAQAVQLEGARGQGERRPRAQGPRRARASVLRLFEQKVYHSTCSRAALHGIIGYGIRRAESMQTALRLLDKEAMDKQRALDAALGQIERAFGKGSIMKLGSREAAAEIEVDLDRLARPRHRARHRRPAARAASSRSTGRKARARRRSRCMSSPRRRRSGGTCAFIDAEHALDPAYAKKLGVNIDDLLISQPDAGEQALEIADTLVRSGAIDVLVIDSVAALVPRAELEGEMGDQPCRACRPA